MPGLMALREEYGASKPLRCVYGLLAHDGQTAVLMETLTELGADVRWVSCTFFYPDHAAAAVVVGKNGTRKPAGIPVFCLKAKH